MNPCDCNYIILHNNYVILNNNYDIPDDNYVTLDNDTLKLPPSLYLMLLLLVYLYAICSLFIIFY